METRQWYAAESNLPFSSVDFASLIEENCYNGCLMKVLSLFRKPWMETGPTQLHKAVLHRQMPGKGYFDHTDWHSFLTEPQNGGMWNQYSSQFFSQKHVLSTPDQDPHAEAEFVCISWARILRRAEIWPAAESRQITSWWFSALGRF